MGQKIHANPLISLLVIPPGFECAGGAQARVFPLEERDVLGPKEYQL